jgi:biopolymer transport protein ExbB
MIAVLCASAWGQPAPSSTASPLDQAYQKEYAYLAAEKTELEQRIAGFDRDAEARLSAANAELDSLQARLVVATRAADQAEDGFDRLDRETRAMDDAGALLATSVQQASDTLGLPAAEDPVAAVPSVFSAARDRIRAANTIGAAPGAYFLADGTRVEGEVFHWGQIASWGVSPAGSGALAPAGPDRMQLRRAFGHDTAVALAAGRRPAMVEVQLYEPERATSDPDKAGGLGQLLEDAGAMGQVLFGLGCVSAALVVIRAVTLAFARRGGWSLVEAATAHVRAGRLEEARRTLGIRGNPIARVLGAILDVADRSREDHAQGGGGTPGGRFDRVVDEALLRELPRIDRFASALVVITAGSPLLGLLGTVTGMIATFDVITEHGTGNPKLMSAGIAEALVCTALGLAVAIPTLLAGNVLASVAESIKTTLERGSLSMVNALERRERAITRVHPELPRAPTSRPPSATDELRESA